MAKLKTKRSGPVKQCPKCNKMVPAALRACKCGNIFAAKKRKAKLAKRTASKAAQTNGKGSVRMDALISAKTFVASCGGLEAAKDALANWVRLSN